MLRRLRLRARRKGAGVRSRLELAPAAYCASAVEVMECFLPGAGSTDFWAVLEPVFGGGAFVELDFVGCSRPLQRNPAAWAHGTPGNCDGTGA
jgi:hypothetical protein